MNVGHGCVKAKRHTVCPSNESPNALSLTCCGKISDAIAGVTGPFEKQYTSPTTKNIAISTTAAALLLLSGKAVVREERMRRARAWREKPTMRRGRRP